MIGKISSWLLLAIVVTGIVESIWHPKALRWMSFQRLGTWHNCTNDQFRAVDPVYDHFSCDEGDITVLQKNIWRFEDSEPPAFHVSPNSTYLAQPVCKEAKDGIDCSSGFHDWPLIPTGNLADMPAQCTMGTPFFALDQVAGKQLYKCEKPNVWRMKE